MKLPNPIEFVKAHPVASAGVVGGGVLLIILLRSGGGGGTTVVQGGVSDAQAAMNAQMQAAQMQNQTGLAVAGMQLTAKQGEFDLTAALGQLSFQLESAKLAVAKELGLAELGAQVNLGSLQSNNELEALRITTQAQSSMWDNLFGLIGAQANPNAGNSPAGSGGPTPYVLNGIQYSGEQLDILDASYEQLADSAAAKGQGLIIDPKYGAIQNLTTNVQLAQDLGYTGTFAGGGFQNWISGQSDTVKQKAKQILLSDGQAERISGW
jgi:hypothetical protein